jgi:hypothetical protein
MWETKIQKSGNKSDKISKIWVQKSRNKNSKNLGTNFLKM